MRTVAAVLTLLCATASADENPCGGGNPCGGYDPCGGGWTEAPPEDPHKALCTEAWANAKSASQSDTNTCSRYFAREADIASDAMWKIPASQIAVLIQRLDACGKKCDVVDDAKAWLVKAAHSHFDLVDPVTNESIDALLDKTLAGKKLVMADVEKLSSVSLWKLRNAPYARHGRTFKTVDLQTFFYGDRGKDVAATKLLPLKPNPKFDESQLNKTDEDNVSVVIAAIHKRGEK